MSEQFQLTTEQEFSIISFKEQIKEMNREQAIEMLADLYRLSIVKEEMYKQMLFQEMGLGLPIIPKVGE